ERHDDREPGRERARVAAEALDDSGARRRDDANRAAEREQHEPRDDEQNDQTSHVLTFLLVDESCCSLDLDDLVPRPGLEDLILDVGARRPFLAADAHAAALEVDALENDGLRALEGGGARTQ